jgi:hypothetical protein
MRRPASFAGKPSRIATLSPAGAGDANWVQRRFGAPAFQSCGAVMNPAAAEAATTAGLAR